MDDSLKHKFELMQHDMLTEDEFVRFSAFVYELTHIHLNPSKRLLLSNRLRKRLKELSLPDYKSYYDYIHKENGRNEEIPHFLSVVTTNETYFGRNPANFDILTSIVVPALIKQGHHKIKIISAGCSTGEETYEIAVTMLEIQSRISSLEFSIDAFDISSRVIRDAKRGVYREESLSMFPSKIKERYFEVQSDDSENRFVKSEVKEKIRFQTADLFKADFGTPNIIFCRNVMIYFLREDRERLVQRFFDALLSGGYLFLGESESLAGVNVKFDHVPDVKLAVYKKP